ncbi:MAG: hypothetical protein AAF288_04640 [Planctomycetota bacterium]
MPADKQEDKTALAIPGGLCIGIGAGLFFFPQGPVFVFTGCTLAGLGVGLILTAALSILQQRH